MARIQGTGGTDNLRGTDNADTIEGFAGKDKLYGYEGEDTLIGGTGADTLEGGEDADVFVYSLGDGNDVITDYEEADVIKFTNGTPTISTSGNDVIFTVGTGSQKGTITVKNANKNKTTITYLDANGDQHTYPNKLTLTSSGATLLSAYDGDSFNIADYGQDYTGVKVINAAQVDHDLTIIANKNANRIIGSEEDDSISGLAGKDTILGGDGNDTINGGKGNDSLVGGDGDDVFVYANGDGNDVITDYASGDKIKITSGTISKAVISGNDYVFTVGSGKITVKNAKDKYIQVVNADNTTTWYPESPAPYIEYEKGKVTLKSRYPSDAFNVNDFESGFAGSVTTIDASEVTHDLSITGNKNANRIIGTDEDDYIDGAAGKDTILGGDGNDTINGGKGNDSLVGGDGDDVFTYASGDGNDVITDYTSGDIIKITSGTIKNAQISGNDYVFTIGSGKITVKNGKDKYIHVVDSSNQDIWYPNNPVNYLTYQSGSVTVGSGYNKTYFDVNDFEDGFAGKVYTINASAVTHSMNITGNGESNFIIGTKQKDTINGGDGDDTITGGKGNDVLTGGDGADIFTYAKGDGNDKITDYDGSEDVIAITGTTVKNFTKKNDDVVFNLASGSKITVVGGANQVVKYTEDGGDIQTYPEIPDVVDYNKKGTSATLLSSYYDDTFDVSDTQYANSIISINASEVTHDLTIIGNKKANNIIGSSQNDTINGKTGNDTLTGGDGDDTFVFGSGDDNNVITDYTSGDIIKITSGTAKVSSTGNDYIITAGKTKITVKGALDKYLAIADANDNITWYPDDPAAKMTYTKGGLLTLNKKYSKNYFDVNDFENGFAGKVYTINSSAVTHSLNITGNDESNVIIGTKQKDTINGGDGDDTITGGKGNDVLTGGNGADVFTYAKGDGNDKITDYEDEDTIAITGTTVKNFTKKGNDVVFNLASGNYITVAGAADKTVYYTEDGGITQMYPEPNTDNYNKKGTAVTLLSGYSDDSYIVANTQYATSLISIDASAVTHDLTIVANSKANRIIGTSEDDSINGGAGKDTIIAGDGNDTINGGKGNDSLVGGDGADVFIYNKGDGNDKIVDYTEEDVLSISGVSVKSSASGIKKSGNNVIFTLTDNSKITVAGGADKVITYDENGTRKTFGGSEGLRYDDSHTAVTLTSGYDSDSFTSSNYSSYTSTLITINASAVEHEMTIGGSDLKNYIVGTDETDYIDGGKGNDSLLGGDGEDTILGGAGNDKIWGGDGDDSLWGGAGADTLYGGEGADTFVFKADGKDVIADFATVDTIMILNGQVSGYSAKGDDVTFNFTNSSQLVVKGGADKAIMLKDSNGNILNNGVYNP